MKVINYLGCDNSYRLNYNYDLEKKISKFQNMYSTILRTLKRKLRKLKFYRAKAGPSLLCGNEVWTLTKNDCKRTQAAEIKFLRSVAGYTTCLLYTSRCV